MGGMYALKAAAAALPPRVAFYGMIRMPDGWKGPAPAEPLDARRPLVAPTLAIIGEQDPYTPPADVAALERTAGRRWCATPRPSTASCTIPTGRRTAPTTPPTCGARDRVPVELTLSGIAAPSRSRLTMR